MAGNLKKSLSVVGCFVYFMIMGAPYLLGNISPYLCGYFRVTRAQTQMVAPLQLVLQSLIMPLGG